MPKKAVRQLPLDLAGTLKLTKDWYKLYDNIHKTWMPIRPSSIWCTPTLVQNGVFGLTQGEKKLKRNIEGIASESILRLALIAALACTSICAGATDYFVNSNRPDDSGDGLSVPMAKRTVQAAVALASNGDTIRVAAGTYTGTIGIDKSLILMGAQAGLDGRTRSIPQAQESVLQPSGSATVTIQFLADNITLDGFTVLGDPTNTLTDVIGIQMFNTFSGGQVLNNIITRNTIGAYPSGNGAAQTIYQFNLFSANTLPGGGSGNGIYTDFGLKNALIASNVFTGNNNAGVLITGALANPNSEVTVRNNDIANGGIGVLLAFTSSSTVDGNRISAVSQGVQIRGADSNISITNNTVTDCRQWPIVCFTRSDVNIDNRDITISGNTVTQNVAVFSTLPGAFTSRAAIDIRNVRGQVTVAQNVVTLSGVLPPSVPRVQGIEVQGATTGYVNIVLNELRGGNLDPAGSATPGAGVRINADLPLGSTVDVKFNKISGFTYGVDSLAGNSENSVHVNFNDLAGAPAINNEGTDPLDGLYNWYGQASGPASPSNPGGSGAGVSNNVRFKSWLGSGNDLAPLDTSTQAAFLSSVGFQTAGGPLTINSEATAAPNPAITGTTVQFSAVGSDPLNRPITYAWDFGDGSTSSGATPTHAYASAGSFTATVLLTTPNGGAARTSVLVTVKVAAAVLPPPLLTVLAVSSAFGPTSGGRNVTISGSGFQPGSVVSFDGVPALSVGFVNASELTAITPAHAMGPVSVVVTRPDAITVTLVAGYVYNDPPVFSSAVTVFPASPDVGQIVTFAAPAVDPEGGPLTFMYSYGDGTSDTLGTHIYNAPLSYLVTITAADAFYSVPISVPLTVKSSAIIDDAKPLTVTALKGAFKMSRIGKDSVKISGALSNLPPQFNFTGQSVIFDVGGATQEFILTAKGKAKSGKASLAFKIKRVKNAVTKITEFPGGAVSFKATFVGSFQSVWLDDGIDVTKVALNQLITMPCLLRFNNTRYTASTQPLLKNKAGKGGNFQFKLR